MFKRFFRYLRALILGKLDQWEDPEVIINESLREMRENQIKNRERAVQAITQKNNLQNLVDQEEKLIRNLEAKATLALQQGNRELARQFLREKGLHDQTLEQLRASLKQAEETAEAVKVAIRREEERFRVKTAEALALKANMKQAQIQIQINKALDGLQFDETAQSWDRAEERIRTMQSEAAARAEVAKTSIDARLQQVEDSQIDARADEALRQLEAKLGLAPVTTENTAQPVTTNTAPETDIDRQLQELEQKLKQQ
jgi:phage shock protein A